MATGDGTNFTTSANMSMRLPVAGATGALGVEPAGLSWLELLVSSLGSTVDGHTHAPGFGAQVPAAGLSINADVSWGQNNLTSLRSARFSAIALGTLGASDLGCLIVSGADLYYVDTAGNQIRLTSGGGVAGTPGSIAGLVSPAAASYTPASKLFALTSSSGFPANLAAGPLSIADATVSGGKAATLKVPALLAANYNLTLPAALPASQKILTVDNTGQMFDAYDVDGTTLQIAANVIGVKAGGIGASQLAAGAAAANIGAGALTGSQLAAATVARSNLAAVGQQISASCGAFTTTSTTFADVTNLTITITTSGRPVILCMESDASGSPATVGELANGNQTTQIRILRGATEVARYSTQIPSGTGIPPLLPVSIWQIDVVGAGTYTYKIQALTTPSGTTQISNYVLVAYEL